MFLCAANDGVHGLTCETPFCTLNLITIFSRNVWKSSKRGLWGGLWGCQGSNRLTVQVLDPVKAKTLRYII